MSDSQMQADWRDDSLWTLNERRTRELLESDRYKRARRLEDISLRFRAIRNERMDIEKEGRALIRRQEALDRERYALTRERIAIAGDFDEYAFCLAPIRRIPVEVLVQIFLATAEDDGVDSIGTSTGSILSQVTQHWRAVACDVPRLWSSFSFPLFGKDLDAQLLERFLGRSGNRPLRIHVDSRHAARVPGATGQRQMELLGEHAHHLYHLRFLDLPNISLEVLRGNLPRLEILEFSGRCRGRFDGFAEAPRLHTVTFLDARLVGQMVLPRQQIRTMQLGNKLLGGYLAQHYPNLTSLTCIPDANMWTTHPHFTWENLEHWNVACQRGGESLGMDFLDSCTAPALTRLEFTLFQRNCSGPKICTFLSRSRCNLTELKITECFLRGADLLDISLLTPNLRTLVIRHAPANTITDRFIEALRLAESPRLPNLVTLRIDGSYLFRDQSLIEMIESRTVAASPGFQTVELVLRDRTLEPILDRFLAIEGVELTLYCLDGEKQLQRVIGSIDPLRLIMPSFGNDSSPAGFLL